MERIGIEFAQGGLRIASVQTGAFPVVTALQSFRLATDEDTFGCLKSFVVRTGLKGMPTVFSVPSDVASLNWIKLPRNNRANLSQMAAMKLREPLARMGEDVALGVVPFESIDEENLECLAIAVPRSVMVERAELLRQVGLEVVGCEIEAQALIRLAQNDMMSRSALMRQLSVTIVDIGLERTRFVVVQNRRVQFVRTVRFGSNRLVSRVAEAFGLDHDEAAAILDQRSTSLDSEFRLHMEIDGSWHFIDVTQTMESLFKEIRRLITYFRTLRSDRSYRGLMERLVLSGELLGIRGFSDGLGKVIGIRTHELNPLSGARLAVESPDLAQVVLAPYRFTVALGLASSPYDPKKQEEVHPDAIANDNAVAA